LRSRATKVGIVSSFIFLSLGWAGVWLWWVQ
jgi:hypothetical protein